jgi:uncharacterized protein YgbK (DUF1537 family)
MNSTPRLGIVADDITGAGDIAVLLAKHGWAVRIFSSDTDLEILPKRVAGQRADAVIIDTNSRIDDEQTAAAKVDRATQALINWGAQVFWKKTCSVFRGNVGAEFDACCNGSDAVSA